MFPNQIPSATLHQILPDLPADLELKATSSIFGDNASELPVLLPHEQLVVAALVRHLAPRRSFEFGTATGRTTWILAENGPADGRVLTLDLPSAAQTDYSAICREGHAATGVLWHRAPSAHKIEQLLADARTLDTGDIVAQHGTQDFLLIDGDHSYDGVRSDTEKALAMAAPHAVFLWHDFYLLDFVAKQARAEYSVYHYLNELAGDSNLVLRHILGTYFVVGSRRFARDLPGRVLQPESTPPFGSTIVRLGDTAVGFMRPAAAPGGDYAAGAAAYQGGDYAGAFAQWLPLAERGHGDAAAGLGTLLINGQGVAADAAQAARWFGIAAEAGHALAQLNLGIMHFNGQGVPRNARLAESWARRAATTLPPGEAKQLAIQLFATAGA